MSEQDQSELVQHTVERRIEAINKAPPGPLQLLMLGKALGYFSSLRDTGTITPVHWALLDKRAHDAASMPLPVAHDEFWDLFPTSLVDLSNSTGGTFNIAADFEKNADSLLGLFQAASGITLSSSQQESAKSVGLAVAVQAVPSVRLLADAWAEVPDLAEFAAAESIT